ncbi:P-loop containing nucleoside triphosphate hydrolase protein [Meira miltonrushii]|uniref:P-loop containing nucleoside triphosphate hydrolase protein n=1 Tax=Meira miltonrushii TaxID=1280837 RepID=A0A316VKT9_9BASI|nr:P-loop containing nucleoside triphosphate hydrolase protein [Meira miltonrushii]PWN36973.1 P-loop containing nucleoside triphosphate hydrolase protein [Meira miltonrushii]
MAFSAFNGTLGCAVYDPVICKINLVEDLQNVILALEIYGIANTMVLDSQTAQALGIFDRESHASVYQARTKEGFSLLSLLSAEISRPAKQMMSQWLTFPSVNIDLINSRLDAVDLFTRIQASSTTEQLKKHVKGIKNIYALASSLISDKATVNTWKGITEFARNAIQIGLTCQSLSSSKGDVAIFEKVSAAFDHDKLTFVHETIDAIIDWKESEFTQRVSVKHGLDAELDEYRQTYKNLSGMMEKVTQTFVADLEMEFMEMYDVATEYYPQIGFVTSLHRKDNFAIDQTTVMAGQSQGWTYQYGSEVKAFFKSEFARELDTNIGDVHSFISGREIEIIAEVQAAIVQHVPTLTACGDVIAELECLLAFAAVAMQRSYSRPKLVSEPMLRIKNGRHPLQELIVETYVPNDCALSGGKGVKEDGMIAAGSGGDDNSIMIITGANACGKSTFLKQLALIVIMAHIGCYVPADSARIGLVDKIFTRMQVDESINSSKGSFQTDMEQVANALNRSTSHSLLLFDEMCKGTLATDGVALFAATIRHLLRRGEGCPRTVAVTHFHEVFHESLLGPSMPITPAHMQIILDSSFDKNEGIDDEEDAEQSIVFLYKLRSGLELHSHAAQCARICGIRQDVIARAIHVSKKSQDHDLKALELSIIEDLAEDSADEGKTSTNAYTLRQKEQVLRAFTAWNIDADRQQAADEGEMAFLDPAVKLQGILNTPKMIHTTSIGSPSESMMST